MKEYAFRRKNLALLMYLQSLIQRKPRAELVKLDELVKKSLMELIEYGHVTKDDQLVFSAGEDFKFDNTNEINAWCAPE